ncbi:MAG: RsmD family RNA methyltransferase [Sandaracinaceae bacterium]
MRIVGGALASRRFAGPGSDRTRPTSERVREALASALEARDAIVDAVVLDLFAGTGALGFEALSRGAARAVLVDRDRRAAAMIRASAADLGLEDRVTVLAADLERGLPARAMSAGPFTLVFADPPYARTARAVELLGVLAVGGVLARDATVVLEHARELTPELGPALAGDLTTYRYGDTCVTVRFAPESSP